MENKQYRICQIKLERVVEMGSDGECIIILYRPVWRGNILKED